MLEHGNTGALFISASVTLLFWIESFLWSLTSCYLTKLNNDTISRNDSNLRSTSETVCDGCLIDSATDPTTNYHLQYFHCVVLSQQPCVICSRPSGHIMSVHLRWREERQATTDAVGMGFQFCRKSHCLATTLDKSGAYLCREPALVTSSTPNCLRTVGNIVPGRRSRNMHPPLRRQSHTWATGVYCNHLYFFGKYTFSLQHFILCMNIQFSLQI